jgi:hypothetical protein
VVEVGGAYHIVDAENRILATVYPGSDAEELANRIASLTLIMETARDLVQEGRIQDARIRALLGWLPSDGLPKG